MANDKNTCFIFHKWGKWQEIGHGDREEGGDRVGWYKIVNRVCERCGKPQYKTIEF